MKDGSIIQLTATLDGHEEPALKIEIAKVDTIKKTGTVHYVARRLDSTGKIHLLEVAEGEGAEMVIAAAMFALTGQKAAKARKAKEAPEAAE